MFINKNKGFTLIELIVCLLIIAISFSIIGGMLYKNIGSVNIKTSVKEIVSILRYARSQAVAEKKTYTFVASPTKYQLFLNDGTNTVSVFTKLLPEKQVFGNVDTKEFKMDFYPFGNSTGGKLEVTYKDKSYFTIKVEKLTGEVKVVEDEKLE